MTDNDTDRPTEVQMVYAHAGEYQGITIPSASEAVVHACGKPNCSHVHVIGLDARGIPFCEIVLTEQMVNAALDIISQHGGHL